jgi:hypothetical protein
MRSLRLLLVPAAVLLAACTSEATAPVRATDATSRSGGYILSGNRTDSTTTNTSSAAPADSRGGTGYVGSGN